MEAEKKLKIVELLVVHGRATKLELEGIDPDYMKVLEDLNTKDHGSVKGASRNGKVVFYTYTPARGNAGIPVEEEKEGEDPGPAPDPSSTAPEGSPEEKISGSKAEDTAPPSLPVIDSPADGPGASRRHPEDVKAPGADSDQLTAYRLLVKNFRLTTSGGRTKITAIPVDQSQAQVALEFCQAGPTKGEDLVYVDVWRPAACDILRKSRKEEAKTPEKDDESGRIEAPEVKEAPVVDDQEAPAGSTEKGHVEVEIEETGEIKPNGPRVQMVTVDEADAIKTRTAADIKQEIAEQELPPGIAEASAGMMKEEPID